MDALLVTYSGNVQGVGFRYTCRELAKNVAVHGYVRNLPSGKVELHAQGDLAEIENFLQSIRSTMSQHIEAEQAVPAAPNTTFHSFSILR